MNVGQERVLKIEYKVIYQPHNNNIHEEFDGGRL
jgi:hypothetical protein